MKNQDLQAEINAIDQESAQLESGVEQSVVKKLLNIVERLASENEALKIEVQNLKDENNRLKGEQGKPDIKANKKKDGDISSETERKQAEDKNGREDQPPIRGVRDPDSPRPTSQPKAEDEAGEHCCRREWVNILPQKRRLAVSRDHSHQ